MATTTQLAAGISKEIALLPGDFPFSLSVASAADDADILALAEAHCDSLAEACAWKPLIDAGTSGIAKLRTGRVTVIAKENEKMQTMITYVPSDGVCWLQAIAADKALQMSDQVRAVFAISLPVHRALVSLGYDQLVTRAFPVDDRMAVFAGALRDALKLKRLEHRLDSTGEITHWTFIIDLAVSLKLFGEMF